MVDMAACGITLKVVQVQTQWKVEYPAFNRKRAYRDEHDGPSNTLPDNYYLMWCLGCCTGCPIYGDRCYAGTCRP